MMFERFFSSTDVVQFVSEDTQAVGSGVALTVTFRVLDEKRWMPLLPRILQGAAPYLGDFGWVIRKEFYLTDTQAVQFIWVVFIWASDGVGLGMAGRTWESFLRIEATRPTRPSASAASPAVPPKVPPKVPAAGGDEGVTQLRRSTRLRTTVLGTEANGAVRSATTIRLGRREPGQLLYVVSDPKNRTVKATRPANGDSADSARAGLSGRPRVHVENIGDDEGGGPAATEAL